MVVATHLDTILMCSVYLLTTLLPIHFALYLGRVREKNKVRSLIRDYYLSRRR